jgi:hypothetical protein
MLAGTVALILVSLVTPPEPPKQIAAFFDNLRRTTDEENLPPGQAQALAADCGTDLLLYDLPGWFTRERWSHFFSRYREDLLGFTLAWLSVALLIAMAWGLMQLGKS